MQWILEEIFLFAFSLAQERNVRKFSLESYPMRRMCILLCTQILVYFAGINHQINDMNVYKSGIRLKREI